MTKLKQSNFNICNFQHYRNCLL